MAKNRDKFKSATIAAREQRLSKARILSEKITKASVSLSLSESDIASDVLSVSSIETYTCNSNSGICHEHRCCLIGGLKSEHQMIIPKSLAEERGYVPCRICLKKEHEEREKEFYSQSGDHITVCAKKRKQRNNQRIENDLNNLREEHVKKALEIFAKINWGSTVYNPRK